MEPETWRLTVASTRSDRSGAATFDLVPQGGYRVVAATKTHAGRGRVFLPDQSNVTVDLLECRSYVVRVSDLETDEPISRAEVWLSEELWIPPQWDPASMMGGGLTLWRPLRGSFTNDDGVVTLDHVSVPARAQVMVQARNFNDPPDRRGVIRLGDEPNVEVKLVKAPFASVRWRVVDGEVAPPGHGAVLTLIREGSFDRGEVEDVRTAHMDGPWLVADGIGAPHGFLAVTGDGRVARAWVDRAALDAADRGGLIEGKDISFRRSRSITVQIRDPSGAPAVGALAVARSQGNSDLLRPVSADEGGLAIQGDLYGGLAEVYVGHPGSPYPQVRVGSVNLDEGSASLSATLPDVRRGRIQMTCDGVVCLPSSYRVYVRGGCTVVSEAPDLGEVVVDMTEVTGSSVDFSVLSSDHLMGRGTLDFGSASEARCSVDLRSGGWFQVDVIRDRAARVSILLEQQDPSTGEFALARGSGVHRAMEYPNGPGDGFRFGPLAAGVYRAVDERAGRKSDPARVVAGGALAKVPLRIQAPQWVTGVVEVPPGMTYQDVRVLVQDPRGGVDQNTVLAVMKPAIVYEDGAFRIQVPGDSQVVVRPWHPWLQPSPDGAVTTVLGQTDVVLRLAEGREVRIRAPDLIDQNLRDLRVGFWKGALVGEPQHWVVAQLDGDQIRFVPPEIGLCALMIDPRREFAPVTRSGVVLIDGVNELGSIDFGPGTTLLVRILTASDADPPRIAIWATRTDAPIYTRLVNSGGERVVELPGLVAGHFAVKLRTIKDSGTGDLREVDVDGVSDIELIYDLR